MESFYCKFKDPKLSEKYFGIAIDSQTIIQPDPNQQGQLVPTIVIGVVLKTISDEGLEVSTQSSPVYVAPTDIQYLELVSDVSEEVVLENYYGVSFDETEDEEVEGDTTFNGSSAARPTTKAAGPGANA